MKKFIRIFVAVIALCVFLFSAWQIFSIFQSRHTANKHYDSYDRFVTVKETTAEKTENTENNTVKTTKKDTEAKCNIDIDFKSLLSAYPDAVGWIYLEDTVINYPVVQGEDNSYYLTRFPNGSKNPSGSIFADYRNTAPDKDDNYIIYGHNMNNDTMFGVLNEYKNQEFYNQHPYFYYLTAEKKYKVDVIAGCDVTPDSKIYNTDFKDNELSDLINEIKSKSAFYSKIRYGKGDKLITLSTCSNISNEARYVLVGVISE